MNLSRLLNESPISPRRSPLSSEIATDSHGLSDPASFDSHPIPHLHIPSSPTALTNTLQRQRQPLLPLQLNTQPTRTALPANGSLNTWSSLNPQHEVQPVTTRPRQSISKTAAGRASKSQRASENEKRRLEFEDAIYDIKELIDTKIKALAETSKKSEKHVREQVIGTLSLRTKRASDIDVLLSAVSEECGHSSNAVKALRPAVIQEYQDGLYSKEEIEQARERYIQQKKRKVVGVRANAKASAADAVHTAQKLSQILNALFLRTGVTGLIMLSKPHVDDYFPHTLIEVNGASMFLFDVFKKPADEVMRLYEQFICSRVNRIKSINDMSVVEMQKEAAKGILKGLGEQTNGKCNKMEYQKYDKLIRARFGVELVGWPDSVEFKPPKSLTNTTALQTLLNRITKRDLYWVKMKEDEVSTLAERLAEEEAGKKKKGPKTNKDGLLRKKRASTRKAAVGDTGRDDGEGEEGAVGRPSKRRRTAKGSQAVAQLPPINPSRMSLSSSEEEEDQSDDDSEDEQDELDSGEED